MAIAAGKLQLDLADGRNLEVLLDGPADGLPLIFHLGTPCGAVLYRPLVAEASRRKLRTVVYSRPGYAGSTANPGRSVADAVTDIEAILDRLNASEFVTIGWSGGGPHALACAARLHDRCAAAASLAGVAPYEADGLDWMAGMGPENVEEFSLAVKGEAALTPWMEEQARVLGNIKPADVAAPLGGLVSDVDKASLTGDYAEFMAECFHRSVSTGIAGWRDDDLAFTRRWAFDLAEIDVPVAVWQGEQDRMVPFTHGQWLAQHIPKARVHLYRDEGHLSLAVNALDRIIDDLLAMAR
jgi:pimeloyl-ACP methyl ester carboxylesterase